MDETRLKRECQGGFCNLEIDVNFNFVTHQWESNKQQLNSLTWRSYEYPQLNDLLIICNLLPTLQMQFSSLSYVQPTPHFCTQSSPGMDINRTDYFNWEFTSRYGLKPLEAFFICETDPLDYKSLKLGTLDQAMVKCGSLMTPHLCGSSSAVDSLVQLLSDAHKLRKFEFPARFMWTGTKRYNATHFRGSRWITTAELKNCDWKTRRKLTH